MIEEQFISFDTAKLAKAKGFNEYSRYYYLEGKLHELNPNLDYTDSFLKNSDSNIYSVIITATSQSILARWLREKYNMCTEVYSVAYGYTWCICKADNGTDILENDFGGPNDGGAFDSYEDAKENCLINALKLIKNGH